MGVASLYRWHVPFKKSIPCTPRAWGRLISYGNGRIFPRLCEWFVIRFWWAGLLRDSWLAEASANQESLLLAQLSDLDLALLGFLKYRDDLLVAHLSGFHVVSLSHPFFRGGRSPLRQGQETQEARGTNQGCSPETPMQA
jgi:hypothetical protein